nr:BPK_HP1_G0043390.mRNA.1.CDS.1 [Saccharomyces cerevisiae]
MTPEQKAKLLRKRGILSSDQLNRIESRNEPLKTRPLAVTSGSNRDDNAAAAVHVPNHNGQPSALANTNTNTTSLYGSGVVDGSKRDASVLDKRPTDRIRPSIRKQDYIEYDFATMQNLNGGYINPKDKLPNSDFTDDQEFESEFGSKKQKTLQDWKRNNLNGKCCTKMHLLQSIFQRRRNVLNVILILRWILCYMMCSSYKFVNSVLRSIQKSMHY